jgi:uncharacterized protein YbjT (DUF2867 family)
MANEGGEVVVVGGTGDLGGRVVPALLARGKRVRALVRPGSDANALEKQGVAIVRGDLTDASSLDRALDGAAAVVTTAAGYTGRRKGDSLQSVDDAGNRNLVDAAKRASVPRFVFTSILTADKAKDVPHFWQKKLIEDYLESSAVPYVSLRPGAFLGGGSARSFLARSLPQASSCHSHRPTHATRGSIPTTWRAASRSPSTSRGPWGGRSISEVIVRSMPTSSRPWPAMPWGGPSASTTSLARSSVASAPSQGLFSERMRDMGAMIRFFETGLYVADTTVQAELFGPVPTMEQSVRKMLVELGIPVQG